MDVHRNNSSKVHYGDIVLDGHLHVCEGVHFHDLGWTVGHWERSIGTLVGEERLDDYRSTRSHPKANGERIIHTYIHIHHDCSCSPVLIEHDSKVLHGDECLVGEGEIKEHIATS